MKPNRQRRSGTLLLPFEWILSLLLNCALITLAALAFMVLIAKVATSPRMIKFMAATGAGAVLMITHLAQTLKCPELHDQICQGYIIIFAAYFLHMIDDLILRSEVRVRELRQVVGIWSRSIRV